MTMDIHLNEDELHNDIEAVRRIREEMEAARKIREEIKAGRRTRENMEAAGRIREDIEKDLEIRLIWNDDNGVEHTVRVIANGPNLWITGYYDKNGNQIIFATEGNDPILNYNEDNDEGCALTMNAITGVLSVLEGENPPRNFASYKSNKKARNAYLICVFLASEMVRNELLELVLLKELREPGRYANIKWKSYLLLYRNWSKVSQALYRNDNSVIRAENVGNNISAIGTRAGTECGNVYSRLISELRSANVL